MRIIGGSLKGRRFHPPKGLPVRPTTDFSKESIFNIIGNRFDFEAIRALDLFAGTGNISYEFASRGCPDITAVEKDRNCNLFIRKTSGELGIDAIQTEQEEVFMFLRNCSEQFDVIFADPPYTVTNVAEIPELVFENQLLNHGGWLILEHEPKMSFENHPRFTQQRKYGSSVFSFFA